MKINQLEALRWCHLAGTGKSWLRDIWRSDDLGTIRKASKLLNLPEPYKTKFSGALKQMSG